MDTEDPWRSPRPPGPAQYARAVVAQLLAIPLLAAAVALDLLFLPFQGAHSNTYRVLARKQSG